uniref:Sema domain-containing protein n=1 Tax=Heterorhabditis bacteriophora TaxID=37862 RepID=A0A1I7WME4_HETBA
MKGTVHQKVDAVPLESHGDGPMWNLLFLLIYICIVGNYWAFSQYSYYSKSPINNVIVVKDKIYVGAVNELSLLSRDSLSRLAFVSTGPLRDSPLCSHDGSSCLKDAVLRDTDNHNKVLQVLPNGLLHCGSVRQGICSLHSLRNLTLTSSNDIPVASNTASASTVSILLPDSRLVVAASHSSDSPYRDPFPAVALREPPDYLVANSGSLEGEAAVFIRAEFRSSFPVRYLKAFRHQHFVYIAAIQAEETRQARAPMVTKLARFCDNDTRFVSYSEIELQCRAEDNSNYPLMTSIYLQGEYLIGSFTSELNPKRSALCIFSMQRIKLTFWYNIDRCRGGTDSIGLPHVGRDSKCINKSRVPLDEDTCELGVGGSIEAVEMAVLEMDGIVTSLGGMIEPPILLAGMNDGQIVLIKSSQLSQLEEYGRRNVGDKLMGTRVNTVQVVGVNILASLPNGPLTYGDGSCDNNLIITAQCIHLIYVVYPLPVLFWRGQLCLILLPLSTCHTYMTCTSCLMSFDPLCQWCHSKGVCTTSAQCPTVTLSLCPLENGPPVPSQLSIDENVNINIPIKHLPQPDGFSYVCHFGSSSSAAVWKEDRVLCPSPTGLVPTTEDHPILLSLSTSLSSYHIVEYNYTVYDCGKFTVGIVIGVRKQEHVQEMGSAMELVDLVKVIICIYYHFNATHFKDKASECVRIDTSFQTEILVPNGKLSELSFPVFHLDYLPKEEEYTCRTFIDGRSLSSTARIGKSSVTCESLLLSFSEAVANITIPLEFVHKQEVIDTTKLVVFECAYLASDCSSCISISPIWGCSWCDGKCSHQCPIASFYPSTGPVEGGTVITIIGRDLGTSMEDVQDRVWVAGSRCKVKSYEISKKIICRLEKGTSSGPVRVAVGRSSSRTAESEQLFSFVKVSLFSAYPLYGPVSGGTKVTLYGQNLNSGFDTNIMIGDIPCISVQRNSTSSLNCIVMRSNSVRKIPNIDISIDDATVSLATNFEFRPDPTIISLYPSSSFQSGGRMITVVGANFDSVLSSRLFFVSSPAPPSELVSTLSTCQIHNSTIMFCLTPKLLPSPKTRTVYSSYSVGFAMDNVTSVRNLGHRIQMRIVPDPEFKPFTGIRIHQGDQALILDGEYLDLAAEVQDYKIFIGSERCYGTVVNSKQLVCSGPMTQPKATDENGTPIAGDLPPVVVSIGRVRAELGLIEYADTIDTLKLWVLVVSTIGALVVLLILLALLWKKRRNERERDYKKIQMQMEHLESNVRKECKQAFAELQTSMMPCGPDDYEGLDVVPFSDFVFRLLWSDGGPSISPSLYASTLPVTLAQFDTLLSSKQFIFALVETAESDPSMSPCEKTLLSSLLIAVLLRNFQYCTDIVLSLLKAHIAKSVHALKYQTERGPVDAVSGNARYTINEAKLLRETVETTILDCYVMNLDGHGPFTVRVIGCDTVTQAKKKTYAGPVRLRCVVLEENVNWDEFGIHKKRKEKHSVSRNFVLEWQCPSRGNVLLQDWSGSSTQKGVRRLNTLSHYGITHNALLVMVPASTFGYRS